MSTLHRLIAPARAELIPALLVQSILLIISQLLLLSICLHYAPIDASPSYAPLSPMHEQDRQDLSAQSAFVERHPEIPAPKGIKRPYDFWQWEGYGTYLEFLAGYIIVLGLLQVVLGRWMW